VGGGVTDECVGITGNDLVRLGVGELHSKTELGMERNLLACKAMPVDCCIRGVPKDEEVIL
jgi:hypothetical protein